MVDINVLRELFQFYPELGNKHALAKKVHAEPCRQFLGRNGSAPVPHCLLVDERRVF